MNMKPLLDAGSAMNGWFAAGKAVISQGMGRLLRPGYWSAKPPAGVDFVSAFARDDDGAWVCQPDGAGGYRWEQAGNVLAGLVDPNADRLLFWDDSAGAYAYLTVGSGLTITGTTITASGGVTALTGSTTWDPGAVDSADSTTATGSVSTTVAVTGALVRDRVICSLSTLTNQAAQLTCSVSAADVVTARLAGTETVDVNLGSGTLSALILRP
jgi:hypothetical protein